jgi:predicted pyridoxine 5'-phosphate oxidase superfamily flavin-nucleotide-binding protein
MSANDQTGPTAFHAGEVLLQEKVGRAEKMAEIGSRVVRRHMPDQHREFFDHLPYLIVGALDAQRQPWATILHGTPGFVHSPTPTALHIAAQPEADDPLAHALHAGAPVGLLGFEAHTRRRNRANGLLTSADTQGLVVEVAESFGNCPKYIQAREVSPSTLQAAAASHGMSNLDDSARALIAHADTLFIASAHPEAGSAQSYGVDVSHRGGKPGFVKVERSENGKDRLLLPDFAGNFFFNTFGNIALNPRIGLLFIDYAGYNLLHVAGDASLILDGPTVAAYAGAERVLSIEINAAIWRSNALPLQWTTAEPSPFLQHTGHW